MDHDGLWSLLRSALAMETNAPNAGMKISIQNSITVPGVLQRYILLANT